METCCNQKTASAVIKNNMNRTIIVALITLVTMFGEIIYGILTGSMALLADGIHMGTHTFALFIAVIAYRLADRHAGNPNFAFSTGKVSVLGGYSNAIVLGITAFFMMYESAERLFNPHEILYTEALVVAILGLVVNIISALILSAGGHDHGHSHGHSHSHTHSHSTPDRHSHEANSEEDHHSHSHDDHNLKAAYIHVLTDAMTSVLAIAALLGGRMYSLKWPDAVVGILGAVVILKWAYELLVSSGKVLVDYYDSSSERQRIEETLGKKGREIRDIHIWKPSENSKAMILEISGGQADSELIETLRQNCGCDHLTLETR